MVVLCASVTCCSYEGGSCGQRFYSEGTDDDVFVSRRTEVGRICVLSRGDGWLPYPPQLTMKLLWCFASLKNCSNNVQCDLKATRIVLLPLNPLLALILLLISPSPTSYCDFFSFSFSALSSITATMTYAIKTTFATTAAVAPARVLLPIFGSQWPCKFQAENWGIRGSLATPLKMVLRVM